jgi:hypothetical protein
MEKQEEEETGKKRACIATKEEEESQEALRKKYNWQLFSVDTDQLWHITNYSEDTGGSVGVVYTHKPTYRPMAILRAPPFEDVEHTTYTLLSNVVGFQPQVIYEMHVSEVMPGYLNGIHNAYMEMGEMDRSEGDNARISMMSIVGMGEGVLEQVPEIEDRRIVVPVKRGTKLHQYDVDDVDDVDDHEKGMIAEDEEEEQH